MEKYIGKTVQAKRATFGVAIVITEIVNITSNIYSVSGIGRGKGWTFTMTKEELVNNIL